MATSAVDDVIVAGFWKVYVGLDAVAIREAGFKSFLVSSERLEWSGGGGSSRYFVKLLAVTDELRMFQRSIRF